VPSGINAILPKADRAKKHIEELKTALFAFHNGAKRPCALSAQDYTASGKTLYEVTFVADIPVEIPLLIGDALQNLRTSLDYLAWEWVLATAGTPTKRTSFPITESAQKYLSDSPGKVAGMRQEVIDKIATYKPYKGGNEALWRLHALNNGDKHRLLIAVASARFGTGQEDGLPTFTTEFFKIPLKKGEKFALPIIKDQDNTQMRSEVAFDEPGIRRARICDGGSR
jgi:hypothetical protein